MSFNFRLQNLDSSGSVGSGKRKLGGAGRPRRRRSAAPFLEHLESRITLSATTLASFIAPAGLSPQAAVITDSSGNLYGTASTGGAAGDGTVFELAHGSGALTALASFNGANGARPLAALIMDGSGNLYGTTRQGGARRRHGVRAGPRQRHDHHAGLVQRPQRSIPLWRTDHG